MESKRVEKKQPMFQCSIWEHDKNFIETKRHLYINQGKRNVLGISVYFTWICVY